MITIAALGAIALILQRIQHNSKVRRILEQER